jgi:aldehyde:ferredoxin oxidoreductase
MNDFQEIGSKIVNMERIFNNKRDFDSQEDVLPKRLSVPNLREELAEYYRLRGWTNTGKAQ